MALETLMPFSLARERQFWARSARLLSLAEYDLTRGGEVKDMCLRMSGWIFALAGVASAEGGLEDVKERRLMGV